MYFLCTENRRGIPPVVFHLSPDSAAEILPLFRKIESVWRLQQTDVQDACRAVVYELLYRIRREIRTTTGGGLYTIPRYLSAEQRKLLEPALGCIHEHLADNGVLSSPSLADVCGISETYLRRLFKAAFDRSPVQYIHEQRCRYAHRLLTEGDLSVQTACFAAGFHSLGYFSRVYRKTFGESPSDTRKHRGAIPEKEDQSCFPE